MEMKWEDSHADRLSNRRHEGRKNEKRNNNGGMRRVKVSGEIRLRKKSYLTQGTQNLPHLKARKGKKIVRTYKDREEERTQHKQKQVKHEQLW